MHHLNFVVLTFALVATFIPIYPANPEHNAPTINDTATNQLLPSLIPLYANRTAVNKTKTDKMASKSDTRHSC